MATKDNLKLFSTYDDYSASLSKKDMDDNLIHLADEIDVASYFNVNDDNIIIPREDEKSFSTSISGLADGNYIWFDATSHAFRGGNIIDSATKGSYSFVYGDNNEGSSEYVTVFGANNIVSGDYSFASGLNNNVSSSWGCAIGRNNTITGSSSFASGVGNMIAGSSSFASGVGNTVKGSFASVCGNTAYETQNLSSSLGARFSTTFSHIFKSCFDGLPTTDDTQSNGWVALELKIKSCYFVTGKLVAIKDDYTTKWIANIEFIITTNASGEITLTKTITDVVKDDDNWVIDFTTDDDATIPKIHLTVTGVASTNINWVVKYDVNEVSFAEISELG